MPDVAALADTAEDEFAAALEHVQTVPHQSNERRAEVVAHRAKTLDLNVDHLPGSRKHVNRDWVYACGRAFFFRTGHLQKPRGTVYCATDACEFGKWFPGDTELPAAQYRRKRSSVKCNPQQGEAEPWLKPPTA